jgi:hypothetical protein
MDMSVYGRLVENDVQTLGYLPAERGVFVLALIGGQPYLATVDTVPMKLEALSATRFVTIVVHLLEAAYEHPEAVIICIPDLFPEKLSSKAHDLRMLQQLEPSRCILGMITFRKAVPFGPFIAFRTTPAYPS